MFFSFRRLQDENYSVEAFKQNGLAVLNFSLGIFRTQKWSSLYRGFNLWNIFNPFKSGKVWFGYLLFGMCLVSKWNHIIWRVKCFVTPELASQLLIKFEPQNDPVQNTRFEANIKTCELINLRRVSYMTPQKNFWKKSWNVTKSKVVANYVRLSGPVALAEVSIVLFVCVKMLTPRYFVWPCSYVFTFPKIHFVPNTQRTSNVDGFQPRCQGLSSPLAFLGEMNDPGNHIW